MPRQLPSYLVNADIQSTSIRYTWDDWNVQELENSIDEALVERFKVLPIRAILAYAIGSAEWLVHRFTPMLDDKAPWAYLDASWATLIDDHYSGCGDSTSWAAYADDDWAGAIKGPIKFSLICVESVISEVHWHGFEDPVTYVTYAANAAAEIHSLTKHVLEDPQSYLQWSEQANQRLTAFYPLVDGDEIGDVVPPEAIDPSEPFDPGQTEMLVNAHLARLDHKSNPFLSSPQAMKEIIEEEPSFEGAPYVFDIEADRARRRAARGVYQY